MPVVCTTRYCKAGQSTQGFPDAVAKECHMKAKKTHTAIRKGIHLSGLQRRKKSCSRSCICVISPLFSLKTKLQGLNGTELRPPLAGGLGLIIFLASECNYCVNICPNEPSQKGELPLVSEQHLQSIFGVFSHQEIESVGSVGGADARCFQQKRWSWFLSNPGVVCLR